MSLMPLDKTGALQRNTATKDAIGGARQSYATISGLSAVPCSVGDGTWARNLDFMRVDATIEALIFTETDVSAKPGDRWLIEGIYYPVLAYQRFVNTIISPTGCYVTICGRRNQ